MTTRRLRSRAALTAESSEVAASSTRPRRGAAPPAPSATIEKSSPQKARQSIHLTVKASPSKLREATRGPTLRTAVSSGNIVDGKRSSRNSRTIREPDTDDEEEAPSKLREATRGPTQRAAVSSRNIVGGKRSSRNSRTITEPDTDDEEEEAEEDEMDVDEDEEEEDEDAEGEEDEDAEGEEDDDMDAEGEEDVEMEDAPAPPPAPKTRGVARPIKPSINVVPAPDISAVEAKEIAMANDDDDDEELSELESQDEEEDEEEEEEDDDDDDDEEEGGEEDAEGEEEEIVVDNNDVDEDMDSDDETPQSRSRDETPDLSKLTRRQRALVVEGTNDDLMALSNEAQKKKHLTAEEITMRRTEMARRRKNLSEKRNEEEKMDTINRLLKKQPSKRQRRIVDLAESGQEDELDAEKASPLFVRYVQTVAQGTRIAVPEEWLESPAGSVFMGGVKKGRGGGVARPFTGRMLEEVA